MFRLMRRRIYRHQKVLPERRRVGGTGKCTASNDSLEYICSIVCCVVQYRRKSWLVIGKETWITMSFLRPAVDAAYRVSTNHDDKEVSIDPLSGMVCNKCTELSWLREYSS